MSAQPTFTPGPWYVTRHNSSEGAIARGEDWSIDAANGDSICFEGRGSDCEDANVHLIAAAPDLYAVAECEEALDMPTEQGWDVLERHGWDSSTRFDLPATEFVRRTRRAALAKVQP